MGAYDAYNAKKTVYRRPRKKKMYINVSANTALYYACNLKHMNDFEVRLVYIHPGCGGID